MRAHIVESKTRGTWQLRYSENGIRKQKQVGTVRDWPTKAEAEKSNEHLLNLYNKEVTEVPAVEALVKRYKAEEMPERKSTRRGYETWLKNYILPRWGTSKLAEMKPDPVEMWLRGLALSSKTKRNIKGILAILWTFGMKKELVPIGRNPMELVTIRKQKGEKTAFNKESYSRAISSSAEGTRIESRVKDHGHRHAQLRTTHLGDTWLAMERR